MTTEWSHLPNATHIERIIASLKSNPHEWVEAYGTRDAAWDECRYAARNAAYNAVCILAWDAACDAAYDAARNYLIDQYDADGWGGYIAARYAILALLEYDSCGPLMDQTSEQREILAGLGVNGALLMIPMAKAFELIKEKELNIVN